MIMSIIRYRRGIKVLAILLVCLFTINTLSTAETIAPVPFKKATLGVQSVFKPLHEAGIEDSAELVYEIIGGVRLFLADENRNYSAVNGILTETYRNSKNKRKIEFLPGTKREGNRIKAKFYVIGREDTVFEIEYTDTESKKDIKKHDGIQYPELKEQLDLMTIYEKTMFDHLGKFQNKIVNPDEYGSIKYTHVHPSESSPDVLVNENNKLVVGSKRFGACIACVLTWMKDGNRYIWIGHYYPPKQQRYNIFLKDKIERLKKEGIKKESIKLILHTSLYGKELMENDGCVQIDSKILSKEMDLVEKNIAINIKTRMPEGYKEKIEFAAISNVIVTNRGVIISYEGMDTKRQIVLWDTMETWVESDLFAEQQKDKIIETNTVIKEIKKEKKETQPADEISVKDAGLHNTAPVEQLTWGNVFQEDDEIVIRISEASVKDKEADSEDDITIGPHKTRGSPDSAKKEKKNNAIQLSSLDKPSLDKILFQTRNDEKIKLVFDLDQYINRKNGLAYVSPQILYVFFRLLQDENIYPEVIGNIVSLSAASKNQIESQRKCLKSEERMDFSDIAMGVFCGMVDDGVFNEFCEIRQNIRFEKFPGTTKLLLVDSPGLGEQASEGLFRIASYLSLFGIETEIINPDKEKVFKKRDDFHIAGVRFVTASLKESLSWVNAIKSTNPGSLVVVGGHEVRSVDRVFDLSSNVDCSIKRLGESGMLDVVMEAQIEKDGITDENKEFILKKLKKVHTREKESVIKPLTQSEMRVLFSANNPKLLSDFGFKNPINYILTTTHCSQGCIFCMTKSFMCENVEGKQREIVVDIEDIIERLKRIKRYLPFAKHVYFSDDNFLSRRNRLKKLFERIREEGLDKHFNFTFSSRLDSLDKMEDEFIEEMAGSNSKLVIVGLESTEPEIVESLGKGKKTALDLTKRYKEILLKVKEAGIPNVMAFVILFTPEETLDDSIKIMDDVIESITKEDINVSLTESLAIFPGTELYKMYEEGEIEATVAKLKSDNGDIISIPANALPKDIDGKKFILWKPQNIQRIISQYDLNSEYLHLKQKVAEEIKDEAHLYAVNTSLSTLYKIHLNLLLLSSDFFLDRRSRASYLISKLKILREEWLERQIAIAKQQKNTAVSELNNVEIRFVAEKEFITVNDGRKFPAGTYAIYYNDKCLDEDNLNNMKTDEIVSLLLKVSEATKSIDNFDRFLRYGLNHIEKLKESRWTDGYSDYHDFFNIKKAIRLYSTDFENTNVFLSQFFYILNTLEERFSEFDEHAFERLVDYIYYKEQGSKIFREKITHFVFYDMLLKDPELLYRILEKKQMNLKGAIPTMESMPFESLIMLSQIPSIDEVDRYFTQNENQTEKNIIIDSDGRCFLIRGEHEDAAAYSNKIFPDALCDMHSHNQDQSFSASDIRVIRSLFEHGKNMVKENIKAFLKSPRGIFVFVTQNKNNSKKELGVLSDRLYEACTIKYTNDEEESVEKEFNYYSNADPVVGQYITDCIMKGYKNLTITFENKDEIRFYPSQYLEEHAESSDEPFIVTLRNVLLKDAGQSITLPGNITKSETQVIQKEKDVFDDENNDEGYMLTRASRQLKRRPVNMYVNLKTIPEEKGQLEENMENLAHLIAWNNTFGFSIRYVLENDRDGNALSMLKGKLNKNLTSCVGAPYVIGGEIETQEGEKIIVKKDELIDIRLENIGEIKENMLIKDREYIVALKDDISKQGTLIPNYSAASAIGLSLAALRATRDKIGTNGENREEYVRFRENILDMIRKIYKRYGVINDKNDFSLDQLELMVTGSSDTKLYYTKLYALPPAIKVISEIHRYHEMIRDVLIAA